MMSDYDRGAVADEDRLPWLEPVDEEDVPTGGVAAGKLLGALIAALVAIGLIVGGSFWLKQRGTETASNEPATIPAPPEPYKTRPANPGGMQVPGQGDATYKASEGADPDAKLDMSAVPEAPIKAPPAPPVPPPAPALPKTAAVPAPKPEPVKTAAAPQTPKAGTIPAPNPAPAKLAAAKPAAPKPAPAAVKPAPVTTAEASSKVPGGAHVQLGAFSSQAKADAAWKKLSGRFAFLGSASEQVVAAKVGGNTVYRLRASGTGADACAKLKAAGETCIAVVN